MNDLEEKRSLEFERFTYECVKCGSLITINEEKTLSYCGSCGKNSKFKLIGSKYSYYKENRLLEILKRSNLFYEITEQELNKKIVGEEASRKVIFLCSAGGRLVENSQIASYNILVNDDAGTGKDYVTGKVLELIPKEAYIHKTRISPTVFTYWHNAEKEPEWTWDGKVFYPEDISEVVLNSDVFKVMCSSGSTATIVIKQQAVDLEIRGKPVMITTTATATPNPELVRRFVILNLDSSEKQTEAIMKRHSKYAKEGIVPEYNPDYREAMRMLKRVKVSIPFADLIDESFPKKSVVMRTHYPRFLDYIKASTSFHQYQREEKEGFILANGDDYDLARECFLKLTSNKYMIPLTINQKKILSFFESEPFLKASVTQLHNTKMNFMTLANLQNNLRNLAKYGILETSNEKDSYNRDLEVFSLTKGYNPNEKIDIPTYKELMQKYNSINNNNNNNNAIIPIISGDVIDTIDVIGIKGNHFSNEDLKQAGYNDKEIAEVLSDSTKLKEEA